MNSGMPRRPLDGAPLPDRPSVWVVIPTKNGLRHLSYSLPSLLATKFTDFRLLVVDDRSSDGTLDFMAASYPKVDAISSRRSPGFAGTVNSGIEYAYAHGAHVVAIANNDIMVPPEWLEAAMPLLKPDVFVGFDELPLDHVTRTAWRGEMLRPDPRVVPGIAGCLYLCPVSIFASVGLFDEGYFMYGEDNDLFFRLKKCGCTLVDSGIPVWHAGEGSAHAGKPAVTWLAYRNAIRFAIKNESFLGIIRIALSLLNQGCNPFLASDAASPNRRRLRRFALPINFFIWAAALIWNFIRLPLTMKRRFSEPERLRSAGGPADARAGSRAGSVLILTPYYLPGYKSGGPIRSLANLTQQLIGSFGFHVITADRERGDAAAFDSVVPGQWNVISEIPVFYVPPGIAAIKPMRRALCRTSFDAIYLNSVFSGIFTVLPLTFRRLRMIPACPVIISPRGELSAQALAHKWFKKTIFLFVARCCGLYSGVVWQAASLREKEDICRTFARAACVEIAMDLAAPLAIAAPPQKREKRPGHLDVVFLARISRIKNLHFAIKCLAGAPGSVNFDIFGPIEDQHYWKECQSLLMTLPSSVQVRYRGVALPGNVTQILSAYDLYFLPSESESFGHGIFEALRSGCPVLIADRTPWKQLAEKGGGWELPLERPAMFVEALAECIAMDDARFAKLRDGARRVAGAYALDSTHRDKTIEIFASAVSDRKSRSAPNSPPARN